MLLSFKLSYKIIVKLCSVNEVCYSQVEAVAAGGGGAAPVGMSAEVVSRLQERATALTQERKRRGRTVPEGLVSHDQIRAFITLASHPVSLGHIVAFINCLIFFKTLVFFLMSEKSLCIVFILPSSYQIMLPVSSSVKE